MVTAIIIIAAILALFSRRSPEMTAGNPDRPPSTVNPVSVPLQVAKWIPAVKAESGKYQINYSYPAAILWAESGGTFDPPGSSGEIGLMQLKQIAIDDLKLFGYGSFPGWQVDPKQNIAAGVAYLDLQLMRTGGNIKEAVRAYNQGFFGKDETETKARLADEYWRKILTRKNLFS